MRLPPLPMILPLASVILIVIWAGGLGFGFVGLNKTGLGEWGAVIVGMALVVGIPTLAALLTLEKR